MISLTAPSAAASAVPVSSSAAAGVVPGCDGTTFTVSFDPAAGTGVLWLSGELDLACVDGLSCLVQETVGFCARQVAVDVSDVTFVDCAALGCLVRAARDANERGVQLRLDGRSPALDRLAHALDQAGLARPGLLSHLAG